MSSGRHVISYEILVFMVTVTMIFQVAVEEMNDLKEVWSELSKVWDQVEQAKEQQWLSVQPRKLRQGLESFLEQLKKFPARLRQYSAYEHISNAVKGFIKVQHYLISEHCVIAYRKAWLVL